VDGGECLIEVLARGEPIGSEFGIARELLLGIDQIRVGRFDLALAPPSPIRATR
jgi:hypothetical protein